MPGARLYKHTLNLLCDPELPFQEWVESRHSLIGPAQGAYAWTIQNGRLG